MKAEPTTDKEFAAALTAQGCEVYDTAPGQWVLHNTQTGVTVRLDAEDESSALFEAWNLIKTE